MLLFFIVNLVVKVKVKKKLVENIAYVKKKSVLGIGERSIANTVVKNDDGEVC